VRQAGVEDRWIRFSDQGRCGLYFLEFGAAPRPSALLYDRKDSAFAHITPALFDWQAIFASARWFHISGITPALGDGALAVVSEALQHARQRHITVSIDLNYRAKLWTRDQAAATFSALLPYCQVLLASPADAEYLFGIRGASFGEIAAALRQRFGVAVVVGSQRQAESVWRNRLTVFGADEQRLEQSPWYEVEIVDRLGAGDALAAGVIHGLLNGDLAQAVHYGAALAALQHTVVGDLPCFTQEEVEAVLRGEGLHIRR
jgi:2-dehydro-3-deoxygluconokinase